MTGKRVERAYYVAGGPQGPRDSAWIETTETYFCGDPKCEATHDDPDTKWDQRTSRALCEVVHWQDAQRIVDALRTQDDYELESKALRSRLNSLVAKNTRIRQSIDAALGVTPEERQESTGQAGIESAVSMLIARLQEVSKSWPTTSPRRAGRAGSRNHGANRTARAMLDLDATCGPSTDRDAAISTSTTAATSEATGMRSPSRTTLLRVLRRLLRALEALGRRYPEAFHGPDVWCDCAYCEAREISR